MPSICHSIKQEYEALKNLTQEFVSACEKVGDPRAFSPEQLRELQVAKQKLEHARDALNEKIENRETKIWKNTWKMLMAATTDSERSQHQGRTIAEVLSSNAVRVGVAEDIKVLSSDGALNASIARDVAGVFTSACALGLLSEEQKITLRAEIEKVEGMILLYVDEHIRKGRTDGYEGVLGVIGFSVAWQLGILERTEGIGTVRVINNRAFRETLVDQITHWAKKGLNTGFDTASVVTGYSAALELELLEKEGRDKILEIVERDDFQKCLVQYLLDVLNGDQSIKSGAALLEAIAAIKKLIELSRRRAPRT